ncbi:hypothetical protein HA466_0229990 [Hirschfeldia incana]|nr:hypothetical protein HA466_0229990 [Hirschfeldia incana]KAJ0239334.1 hypothetical protein HA466_0229990 [Hirschfeldia incana]
MESQKSALASQEKESGGEDELLGSGRILIPNPPPRVPAVVEHPPERTFNKSFSFRATWRSFGNMCPLTCCSLPAVQTYCCTGHEIIAKDFSSSQAASLVLGGFCSTDEIETTCCKALLYHARKKFDVGIPLLHARKIFTSSPALQPDVFEPLLPVQATAHLFFTPLSTKAMFAIEGEDGELVWEPQSPYYLELDKKVFPDDDDDEICVTVFDLPDYYRRRVDDKGVWLLYSFVHKDKNLCCLTFTPDTELAHTRLPTKDLNTKKNKDKVVRTKTVRAIVDGKVGPPKKVAPSKKVAPPTTVVD